MATNKGKVAKQVAKAEARERERKALELRKAGMTYQQIADSVGYGGSSSAHRAVKRALDRITAEPAEDLRKLMGERLNTMLMHTWPRVQDGDPHAISQALRIMDREAALHGLDAPKEINIHGRTEHVLQIGGSKAEYMDSLRQYRQQALGARGAISEEGEEVIVEAEVVEDEPAA